MRKTGIPRLYILTTLFIAAFFSVARAQIEYSDESLYAVSEESLFPIHDYNHVPESWNGLDDYLKYVADGDSTLRLAIVMSDIYSKKDTEFVRGMLLGIDKANLPANSVSLKILNGEISPDSVSMELSYFDPHLIISTNDKATPENLISYAVENDRRLINVFDVRSAAYLSSPYVYQLLSPSPSFSSNAGNYLKKHLNGGTLLIVGDPDPSDVVLQELLIAWPTENLYVIPKESLSSFILDEGVNYLIYPTSAKSQEVKEILEEVEKMMFDNPINGFKVIGRQNWVAFSDFSKLFSHLEVFIPVKCYFDQSEPKSKKFISDYKSKFGKTPVKAFPVYAVMGYDVALYFLPKMIGSDLSDNENMIQLDMDFEEVLNGGYFNKAGYVLHFEPGATSLKKEFINN